MTKQRDPVRLFVILLLIAVGACSVGEEGASNTPLVGTPVPVTRLSLDGVVRTEDQWRYRAVRGSDATEIDLGLPLQRVAPERFVSLEKLAETDDGVVVIIDHHASRSDGRCSDGREVFVHVLSLPQRKLLFERLVASCIDNIAPPEPYASFAAGVLTIGNDRWIVSPAAVTRE